MKTMVLTLLIILTVNAQAATEGGGGGNVVVCYDQNNQILDMKLYDFWNAQHEYNLTIPIDNKTPYMVQIKKNTDRLRKLDPTLAQHLSDWSEKFAPEKLENSNTVGFVPFLEDNGDGQHIILPQVKDKACYKQVIERIAQFKKTTKIFEREFLIVQKLWNKAPESVKYGLIQHEILYRLAMTNFREFNSRKAQYFNAVISSNEFNGFTWQTYYNLLTHDLNWGDSKELSIRVDDITYLYKPKSKLVGKEFVDNQALKVEGDVIIGPSNSKIHANFQDYEFIFSKSYYVHYNWKTKSIIEICGILGEDTVDFPTEYGNVIYLKDDRICINTTDGSTEPRLAAVKLEVGVYPFKDSTHGPQIFKDIMHSRPISIYESHLPYEINIKGYRFSFSRLFMFHFYYNEVSREYDFTRVTHFCGVLNKDLLGYPFKNIKLDYLKGNITCVDLQKKHTHPYATQARVKLSGQEWIMYNFASSMFYYSLQVGLEQGHISVIHEKDDEFCGFLKTDLKTAILPTVFGGNANVDLKSLICIGNNNKLTQGKIPQGAVSYLNIYGMNIPVSRSSRNFFSFSKDKEKVYVIGDYCGKRKQKVKFNGKSMKLDQKYGFTFINEILESITKEGSKRNCP